MIVFLKAAFLEDMKDRYKNVYNTLEYNLILKEIATFAGSKPGKDKVLTLLPGYEFKSVSDELTKTNDALSRITRKGPVSYAGLDFLDEELSLLTVGSSLTAAELLKVDRILECAVRVKDYGCVEVISDSLSSAFDEIDALGHIHREIGRCIISEDEISDTASAALFEIRKKLKLMDEQIHHELNRIVNSQSTRTYLQDGVITSRNGRYCVPVKAEYRSMVPGIIHDESQSKATIFIEPMVVVKLTNDMNQLKIDEKKEIDIILAKLSKLVYESSDVIRRDIEILTMLDFVFAKGLYAKEYNCIMPVLNHKGLIDIKQGRHPLIDKNRVVPIDIRLDSDTSMVVITGPNTGGKTVSLKTVGLFVLMTMAGILIPARYGSSISVFDGVYADIGDEQSIEQSLSTFSSHMVRIVDYLKDITLKSLVLFDELGAGTDPTEGAALAMAILDHLHKKNIRCIATTHYSEIKLYALSTPGVINASCEFDVASLSPTYRLLMGVPGKSNAFAISKRLGLSDEIIDEARTKLDENKTNFEDVIVSLEESKAIVMKEKEEIAEYKAQIKKLQEALAKKNENIDNKKDEIIRHANEEAGRIMAEAKATVDQAIRNLNKYGSVEALEKERTKLREGMKEKTEKAQVKAVKGKLTASDIKEGMTVRIIRLNTIGTVVSLPNSKGNLYVTCGSLSTQVNISDLEIVPEEPKSNKPGKSSASKIKAGKSLSVSAEINLIGMTKDEAIMALDKYLDDAYIAHISPVRIVHGKGSGILREAVAQKLRRTKTVKSYRLGEYGEGDSGVTIAEFN